MSRRKHRNRQWKRYGAQVELRLTRWARRLGEDDAVLREELISEGMWAAYAALATKARGATNPVKRKVNAGVRAMRQLLQDRLQEPEMIPLDHPDALEIHQCDTSHTDWRLQSLSRAA